MSLTFLHSSRWKFRLPADLVTWSAGGLNLTLCEFSGFLCKLEKLSVQTKLQGLRYSRIFLWEGNGEPIDCLCLFTPYLPLNSSTFLYVSCKLKCQGVPGFFLAPRGPWWLFCGIVSFSVSGVRVPFPISWLFCSNHWVWAVDQRAFGSFTKMTAQSFKYKYFCLSLAISLCVLLPPRGLFKIICELRILQTLKLRTDVV